jgi:hypothetical protein
MDPITPVGYSNLLLKIQELFTLCTVLVSQNTLTSNGQAISRMYYAFYHLARLVNINNFNKEQKGHKATWDKIFNPSIKTFGFALKNFREKYDYDPINPHTGLASTHNDFTNIVSYETEAKALIDEVERTLPNCKCLQSIDTTDIKNAITDLRRSQSQLFGDLQAMASLTGSLSQSTPPVFFVRLWRRLCAVLFCKSSIRKCSRIP